MKSFPSDRRYAVLYADPPWHFEVYNEESGVERAVGNHYSTMSLDEICALPVLSLASPDAVLFMWTTVPHLRESFDVLVAWGFEYKTNIVWVKDKIGLGYFVRNQHELLLVATRGDIPSPSPANRPPSVIRGPRREHSRKPDEAYDLIERMYPELPKIELFARQTRCTAAPTLRERDGHDFTARLPAALRLDQCASCCPVSCTTRMPSRRVMRAIGQRAIAAR
jgi:N6-adenosine-specific RNA methylase IME4